MMGEVEEIKNAPAELQLNRGLTNPNPNAYKGEFCPFIVAQSLRIVKNRRRLWVDQERPYPSIVVVCMNTKPQ